MRFKNKQERMEHPQARFIPDSLWNKEQLFNRDMSDTLMILMEEPAESLSAFFKEVRAVTKQEKRVAWLALASRQPKLSIGVLIRSARDLKMSASLLFQTAVIWGDFEFLQAVFGTRTKKELQTLIVADDFCAFKWAAESGQLHLLKWMAGLVPDRIQEMIESDDYYAFSWAAANRHLSVLEWMEKQAPLKLQNMITADYYSAFKWAAENGHIEVLEWVAAKAPGMLQVMIEDDHYYSFRYAAKNGFLEVLQWLARKAPDSLQEMIAARQFYAFGWATTNDHLPILQWLAAQAPASLDRMLVNRDFDALKDAVAMGHRSVARFLLSQPVVFAYAEQHQREYGPRWVIPFVNERLKALRSQKLEAETANPNAVFDVQDPKESTFLFYVLKNLIRRNNPDLRDDLLFLLELPSVKALIHTAVNPGQNNELLRLALRLNNESAAELLLTIPAVRDLAEANDYYRAELQGSIDLRALAKDRESSMTALSKGEQKRLQAAITLYQPMLKQAGIRHIINALRDTLKERYQNKPARIQIANAIVELPLLWKDFMALRLSKEDVQQALKAYYVHPDHSAWRYLLKPNPWMNKRASYVHVNPNKPNEKWSTFEEFQPLISLLFLAALDQETPPSDGYTFATRLNHFIEELAYIARSHNWDNSRIKCDSDGVPLYDEKGEPIMEEYDDLKGDRPTCFSGVKRRLFQSVQGHPLFKILTKEVIDEEVRDFIRNYVHSLTKDAPNELLHQLQQAWDNWINNLDKSGWPLLRRFNPSQETQVQFINYLMQKYPNQFSTSPLDSLYQQVRKSLIPQNIEEPIIIQWGHFKIDEFLKPKVKPTELGFFASGQIQSGPVPMDEMDEEVDEEVVERPSKKARLAM